MAMDTGKLPGGQPGLELVWKTLSGSRYRISVRQVQNDR
jgi:hypothetical protein